MALGAAAATFPGRKAEEQITESYTKITIAVPLASNNSVVPNTAQLTGKARDANPTDITGMIITGAATTRAPSW